jgi:VanZ family protein
MKLRYLVIILWTIFLLSLLLSPIAWWKGVPGPWEVKYFDKVAHFGLFAITGFVGVFSTNFQSRFKTRVLIAIVLGLFLAIITEFLQYFIPNRHAELYDVLIDAIGLGIGLLLYAFLYRNHTIRSFLRL